MEREYPPVPLVAVGLVVLRDQRILLVQRRNNPGAGLWSIPGGMVELGETVRGAAEREVREECGIETRAGDVVEVVDAIQRDAGGVHYHYVIIDFLADFVSGELQPSDDSLDVRWVSLPELDALPMVPSALALARKVLGQ